MGDFVTINYSTDPSTLADTAVDYLRTNLVGWEPADGSVENHLIEALARIVVELTQMASTVPGEVFQEFGQQLVGLPALQGSKSTIASTWTAVDTAGYVIPAGTQVGYRVTGDELVVFEVDADYVITPGASSLSPVTLQALEVGTAWNGVPAGDLELLDALSWVASTSGIVANSASTGGVDAETDEEYRDRLAAELRLLTPRPILPDDFAVLARRVTGVTRALAIDGYDPGTNEVQNVAITGTPTGGTFTLTYSGQTTGAIAYNATAATVQAALVALSNIGPGDVAVTGGPLPGTAVDVEFTGALGGTNVAGMTHTDSLTGGTAPAVAVTTTTAGAAAGTPTGNERMVCVAPLDVAGVGCSAVVRSAVKTYLDGLREVSFVVNVVTPTFTAINVTYAVKVASGYDSATVVAACTAALTAFLSPASWAGGSDSPPVWTFEDKVRYLAVSNVIAQVPGVQYVDSLTVNAGTSDVTLSGAAPLPAVGTITGSAV